VAKGKSFIEHGVARLSVCEINGKLSRARRRSVKQISR